MFPYPAIFTLCLKECKINIYGKITLMQFTLEQIQLIAKEHPAVKCRILYPRLCHKS